MSLFHFGKKDTTQTSLKRTRHIWDSIGVVSADQGIDFDALDLESKQKWLGEHWLKVIDQCIVKFGKEYANLRNFNAFVVSNAGTAMLYCEKKKS